jgi:hypothetical protein
MARNPIARIRFWGHVALVTMVSLTIGGAFITSNYWDAFAWLIGFVAFGFGALLFFTHVRYPEKVDAAWDEQNTAADFASHVFGYWATLVVFLLLLGAVLLKQIDSSAAFFWLGPVLGVGPSIHYIASVLRGRAE